MQDRLSKLFPNARRAKAKSPNAAYRENKVPSLDSGTTFTGKSETPEYSGEEITGITVTHKSNLVPVSKREDPTIYATMRRG